MSYAPLTESTKTYKGATYDFSITVKEDGVDLDLSQLDKVQVIMFNQGQTVFDYNNDDEGSLSLSGDNNETVSGTVSAETMELPVQRRFYQELRLYFSDGSEDVYFVLTHEIIDETSGVSQGAHDYEIDIDTDAEQVTGGAASSLARTIEARDEAEGFAANLDRAGIGDPFQIERINEAGDAWENVRNYSLDHIGVHTPQLANIYGGQYKDTSFNRFRVDGDDIQRIHDMINDPERECVWGVTRKDTGINYCFRMDRDGTIQKTQIGDADASDEQGKSMHMCWGGGRENLWMSDIGNIGYLIKVDPDTLNVTKYLLPDTSKGSCAVTWHNGYVMISEFTESAAGDTESKIYKFDPSSETFVSQFTVIDAIELYWALFDGAHSWFAGQHQSTGNATLVKIDINGNYSIYDLGAGSSGAEITYDGTFIWYGNNDGSEIAIRFNPDTESIKVFPLSLSDPYSSGGISPRLIGYDGRTMWAVGTSSRMSRFNPHSPSNTEIIDLEPWLNLDGLTYSHGLTFDGRTAWIGSWQDTCYIWRVPMKPLEQPPYSLIPFTFGGASIVGTNDSGDSTKYFQLSMDDAVTSRSDTQFQLPFRYEFAGWSWVVETNTMDGDAQLSLFRGDVNIEHNAIIPAGQTGYMSDHYRLNEDPIVYDPGELFSVRCRAHNGQTGDLVISQFSLVLIDRSQKWWYPGNNFGA